VSWMILFLEIGYPVFVWPHRTRNWWLAAIIVMHLATGIMMGLLLFAWVMIVANVSAFYPSREIECRGSEAPDSNSDVQTRTGSESPMSRGEVTT